MMAETLDTRPKVVNINHYGGDTLTLKVTAPETLVTGRVWNAHVRPSREVGAPLDAEFIITPPEHPVEPSAYVVLSAVDCARLIGTGPVITRRAVDGTPRAVQIYTGVWDCQISDPESPDPVTTLVQGVIVLDPDVTRLPS